PRRRHESLDLLRPDLQSLRRPTDGLLHRRTRERRRRHDRRLLCRGRDLRRPPPETRRQKHSRQGRSPDPGRRLHRINLAPAQSAWSYQMLSPASVTIRRNSCRPATLTLTGFVADDQVMTPLSYNFTPSAQTWKTIVE